MPFMSVCNNFQNEKHTLVKVDQNLNSPNLSGSHFLNICGNIYLIID